MENNVRKHGEKQIEEFAKSLKQFGQIRPFVIDENNTVLVGNGMLDAMKLAGLKTCQAYRVTGLSETQKKKLVLTDNKIYSLGADNLDNIMDYLQEFADAGDFEIPGFDEDGIRALTRTADEILDDAMSYGVVDSPRPRNDEESAGGVATEGSGTKEPESTGESTPEGQEQQGPPSVMCPNCGEVIRV